MLLRLYHVFCFLITVTIVLWFSYLAFSSNTYFNAKKLEKNYRFSDAIEKLNSIYIPGLMVTTGNNRSLSNILARNYTKIDSVTLAKKYFDLSLSDMPYSPKNYYDYALYMFKIGDYKEANILAMNAYQYNKNYVYLINLIIKSSINIYDFDKAECYYYRLKKLIQKSPLRSYDLLLERRRIELDKALVDLPFDKTAI